MRHYGSRTVSATSLRIAKPIRKKLDHYAEKLEVTLTGLILAILVQWIQDQDAKTLRQTRAEVGPMAEMETVDLSKLLDDVK